ncbi:cysteine desulfurase family protein [Ravibacter arvi]|uniref:Cysteine desulfurase family protein n=1 Tax=Ravibacter arvi TaxID=2051041 RepID=A0ABP8LVK5_9BACT
MKAYLDNAATTPLDPEVLEAMLPVLRDVYGNPSSIHASGRQARSLVERARKTVAELLGASPAEIFFTSGGTESNNTILCGAIESYNLRHVITSPLEHHAVLHTLENLRNNGKIRLSYLTVNESGDISQDELEALLAGNDRTLVSLMHGNNEIGNLNDIQAIGSLCAAHGALFHSDTVQTMGHFRHNVQNLDVNFMVGAAHKFHGPKGIGFFYQKAGTRIQPFIHGGAQERNMRGGTENVYGIVGLAKALEIAYRDMATHEHAIRSLKMHMKSMLEERIEGVLFNGRSADPDRSLYTVLNVSLPMSEISDMLLFNLDIAGICASGGSACASGTDIGSHVLQAIQATSERPSVRFSFGKYSTTEEVEYAVEVLEGLFRKNPRALEKSA